MVALKTLIPATALLFSTSANAIGCYVTGKSFDNMHGALNTFGVGTTEEVKNDINTTCGIVAGKTFKRGDPSYSRCSTWEVYVGDGAWNHINWEIRLQDGGSADSLVMSYEKCVNALNRELGGCSTGSEQNNGGFYYKIDPNNGPCGTPQSDS
jgi:hypothetical protein